jgi:hypothetical protein
VLVFATAALTVASGFYYVYRASRLPSPGATDS